MSTIDIKGNQLPATRPEWKPSDKQKLRIKFVMDAYADMDKKRKQSYAEFTDRTLVEFLDDNQKRMNAYVPTRESQGKDHWQSNFATRAYANKAKALLAATARNLPDMKFKAVNETDSFNFMAADMMRNMVRHSYNQGDPQQEFFFLAWSVVTNGTVLSYEGFEKQSYIKKSIKSFDIITGDVEFDEEERISEGEPVSFEIPLTDLLVRNFYIRDIQEQPDIIWESYYADRERFMAVWGKYPNAKYVGDAADLSDRQSSDTFFTPVWKENCSDERGYLVLRYMNKYEDVYRVIANGVELYNGPMLWSDITRQGFGKKVYPIAKTIYEPFANGKFFYGNSMVNSAMGEGDVLNTLYNTALDKTYRSMVPPLLVGNANKDQLDLIDEVVAGDTKIYVQDVTQVEPLKIQGMTPADVNMIQLISQGLDLTTVDQTQQGVAQKYITARAAVAADERARQLKGVFFMFLESLWLQKVRLRTPNILLAYTRPRIAQIVGQEDSEKFEERVRTFNVKGAQLSDGKQGTLGISFMNEGEMQERRTDLFQNVEKEENNAADNGQALEKVILPYGYFDQLSFDLEIIPETLWQSSQSINMALFIEKMTAVRAGFPEIFAQNKQIFFTDLMKIYGDDVQRYDLGKQMSFEQEQALQLAGAGGGGAQNTRNVQDLTGSDEAKTIAGAVEQGSQ